MRRRLLLPIALALGLSACAEEEPERIGTYVAGGVVLANREPGSGCRGITAVELRSGRNDMPSAEALRALAYERGANYVVIDTFSVFDEGDDTAVLTRARLFRCPLACVATMQ